MIHAPSIKGHYLSADGNLGSMASGSKGSLNIGALTWMVMLIAAAIGLAIYFYTKDIIVTVSVPLLIMGAYELISSLIRNRENDQFGTNEAGAAVFWGFIILTLGGAGVVWWYTGSIIIVAIFAILMGAAYMAVRLFNRE